MAKSPAQRLAEIEAIITKLEDALDDETTQEYTINGRAWKRVDFPKAIAMYEDLRQKYLQRNQAASGGRRVLGGMRRL